MRAPPPHPGLATESTEPVPTHSPYSCCFASPHSAVRCSSATVQHQSNVPGVEGGAKQKKVVRGSVDSVAIQSRQELREGIGNAIKVICKRKRYNSDEPPTLSRLMACASTKL